MIGIYKFTNKIKNLVGSRQIFNRIYNCETYTWIKI